MRQPAAAVLLGCLLLSVGGRAAEPDSPSYGALSLPAATPPKAVPGSELWGPEPEPLPPLSHLLWPPHFRHGNPDDPGRHVGLGYPLTGTSWLNRPYHIGWLVGGLFGDDLIRGEVGQESDLLGGYRLGWDFDHYWGLEGRFAFSNVNIQDLPHDPRPGTSRDHFYDVSLLYYPWGDAHWRPYFSYGLGVASFYFRDRQRQAVNETLVAMPFGGGVKYHFRNWLTLRFALMDNLAFGGGRLDTMHNLSLDFGVEVRFGGPRTGYFPYHAPSYLW